MKIFNCDHCGNLTFFENTLCSSCGSSLGYLWRQNTLSALTVFDDHLEAHASPQSKYRYCQNSVHGACNWLVPVSSNQPFCRSCEFNRTIPSLDDASNLKAWCTMEVAKRRLMYSLIRFNLPLQSKLENAAGGFCFDFLGSVTAPDSTVMTGHDEGVITINIAEADTVYRVKLREGMSESYRTLIGHFRHEIGHYYWDVLIAQQPEVLAGYRALFGDERADYSQALQQHYTQGAPANWRDSHVSAYASSHPWEDWSETWAHYLHLVDMLETAYAFGMSINPNTQDFLQLKMSANFDPYCQPDFEPILSSCLPMTYAANSLNRSMGQSDLYPFILPSPVIEKLRFVHQLIQPE